MKKYIAILYCTSILFLAASCGKDDTDDAGLPPLPELPDPNDIGSCMDDINFMRYCYENFDINKDGKISQIEANSVWDMKLDDLDIKSLKGIEYFPRLNTLSCWGNPIQNINLSRNQFLTQLTVTVSTGTLDVSKNTALVSLACYICPPASLDVSKNTALVNLNCSGCQLTSLDISKNTALVNLDCSHNQLTSLDVSNNPALVNLDCIRNQLTSLDVSNNPALEQLFCDGNQLTSLDVSNNPALEQLTCNGNQFTSLDVSNNPVLNKLYCYSCTNLLQLIMAYNQSIAHLAKNTHTQIIRK